MPSIVPIATFRSPVSGKFGLPRQSSLAEHLRGRIVFEPDFKDPSALSGLEGFDRIWLIWGFSENASDGTFHPTVRPPRLGGNERVGVWASRSPFRPNGLGLSAVRVAAIRLSSPDGPVIEVLGADLADGTPIYDIKPYVAYSDSFPDSASGFAPEAPEAALKVVYRAPSPLSQEDTAALTELLSLDPRPAYHDDPTRIYGLTFNSHDIHFRVNGNILEVIDFTAARGPAEGGFR